jgi:hypothetical protein
LGSRHPQPTAVVRGGAGAQTGTSRRKWRSPLTPPTAAGRARLSGGVAGATPHSTVGHLGRRNVTVSHTKKQHGSTRPRRTRRATSS